MDFDEINPIAVVFGIVGVAMGYLMISRMSGGDVSLGIIWKILTPIVCGIATFFIGQKMISS